MFGDNIFSVLGKYNSATDENYLTESFVFLINSLLERERPLGLGILNQLCVQNNEFCFNSDEIISVLTQDVTEQGKPDIRISSPEKLIYIEVKYEADLGNRQIERYKEALTSSSASIKHVNLLTCYPTEFQNVEQKPYKHIRWTKVYDWLLDIKSQSNDSIIIFLLEHFLSFIEEKGMTIQKVGSEYLAGMNALNSLMNMIESGIEARGIRFFKGYPRSAGWDFKGFWMDGKRYWCGIHFNNPLVLTFEMTDKEKYNEEIGKTTKYKLNVGKERLWFRLPLGEHNFFSLNKDEQCELINDFINIAYTEAQKMKLESS